MPKESVKARQRKREKMVLKYAKKRKFLKDSHNYELLQRLPRDASPVRLRNRCSITGRSRGYMRQFGISRIVFRNMASQGLIPGIKKASW
ncbi:30S ribosomal protein S14 [Blattabacterium cuenoti]